MIAKKVENNLPEIRIAYARLLKETISAHLADYWGIADKIVGDEEYESRADRYRQWWEPYEKIIVEGICEMLDLDFRQNIIDVHVVPWRGAISNPMVLRSNIESQDALIMVLTHELIHRLLADNTSRPRMSGNDFYAWKDLYGERPLKELIHVPVHALLKAVYLDILGKPELLDKDIKNADSIDDETYKAAWNYVEQNDYIDIVNKIKKYYE